MIARNSIWAITILCILAAILAGCGSITAGDLPQPAPTRAPAGGAAPIVTTPEAAGVEQRQMKPGETFELRLSGNPTTGFSWEVAQIDDKVIRLLSADYVSDVKGGTPLAGAGGVFVFRFQAVSAGQTTVKLVYHRPWEKGVEPLQTHVLEITVQ